ncbi:hypothetical protein [Amycolatopsis minnesotensis]|uniref:Thiopeptide-type bacteriocin biosynthesis domain-containing protein n=1 Tax=Amycolatopsis minnesotensis TaxID=337894 RepID=A0ABP5C879_9PSEU
MDRSGYPVTPRSRSFRRLAGPASPGAALGVVREFRWLLRRADPAGTWSFRHLAERGNPAVGIWFRTTAGVHAELDGILRTRAGHHGLRVSGDEPVPVSWPGIRGAALAEQVGTASSDFALALAGRTGRGTGDEQLPLALLLLGRLLDLVDPLSRPDFLFLCWRHGITGLSPRGRVELAARTDARAEASMRTAAALHLGPAAGPWEHYAGVLRHTAVDRRPADNAPANYLLFQHSWLTHNRIGVPPPVTAGAARVLRSAILAAPEPVVACGTDPKVPAMAGKANEDIGTA